MWIDSVCPNYTFVVQDWPPQFTRLISSFTATQLKHVTPAVFQMKNECTIIILSPYLLSGHFYNVQFSYIDCTSKWVHFVLHGGMCPKAIFMKNEIGLSHFSQQYCGKNECTYNWSWVVLVTQTNFLPAISHVVPGQQGIFIIPPKNPALNKHTSPSGMHWPSMLVSTRRSYT